MSVDGERFVDPLPLSRRRPDRRWPPLRRRRYFARNGIPFGAVGAPGRRPSRTLAVLSLIFGLVVGHATGWMPIFFVVGAAAGIAAIVLGVIARTTHRRGHAGGSGMAVAGLVLGPIGLASCAIGVILTGVVFREVEAFTEPGPLDVEITSCEVDGRAVRIAGTIENLDDEEHDYSISVEVRDGSGIDGVRGVIDRDDVAGRRRRSRRGPRVGPVGAHRADTPDEPRCEVFRVNGPFPFGVDPNP